MRILVTGVSGQVGGALVARLPASATVLAADRSVLDLAAPQTIAGTLDRLAPDIVFNPAAYTAVDKAEDEPELAMRVNAEAPGAMARWAAARDVPLVHFSTDYVFDGSGERAWREDDAPQPLSVYGATKLAGENEIRSAGGTFLIVRTSWVYAAAGKNFLRTIARLARERSELRIVADQIGAPTSAALIGDVVAGMLSEGMETLQGTLRARRRPRSPSGLRRDELVRLCLRDRRGPQSPRPDACGRTDRSDRNRGLPHQGAAAAQFAARSGALAEHLWNCAAALAECAVAGTRPAGAGIDHHQRGVAPCSKARY